MRIVLPLALAAATVAGCGSSKPVQQPHQLTKAKAPTIVMFRRIRYEGATLRTMYVHADGAVDIDIPSGGAGGAKQQARLRPAALAAIRSEVARTPWRHLSRRKAGYLAGSGAYFIVRRGAAERVASSDGMSVDLLPLVKRLNRTMNGAGLVDERTRNRFYQP